MRSLTITAASINLPDLQAVLISQNLIDQVWSGLRGQVSPRAAGASRALADSGSET